MDGSNARTHIHIHSFVRSFPSTLESLHPTDRPSLGTCNHATMQQEDEMSIKVHITGNGVQSINPIRDISFNENGNKENYRTFQPSNNDQRPTTNDVEKEETNIQLSLPTMKSNGIIPYGTYDAETKRR